MACSLDICCHAAMPGDGLDVSKMNVKPGGKQRVMRDGW